MIRFCSQHAFEYQDGYQCPLCQDRDARAHDPWERLPGIMGIIWQDHRVNIFTGIPPTRKLGMIGNGMVHPAFKLRAIEECHHFFRQLARKHGIHFGKILVDYPEDYKGWILPPVELGHEIYCNCQRCRDDFFSVVDEAEMGCPVG